MPSSGISGVKRKTKSDEKATIVGRKEFQNEGSCLLCGVSVTSGGWKLHMHGKRHKTNEASSKSCKTAINVNTDGFSADHSLQPMEQVKGQAPMEEQKGQVHTMEDEKMQVKLMEEDKTQGQPTEDHESQVNLMENGKTQATKKWVCSLCHISTTSKILLRNHLEGRKHKAKETKLGSGQGMSEDTGKSEEHKWFCSLCKVSTLSEKNLKDHIQGKKHKAKSGLLHPEIACVNSNEIEKISESMKSVEDKSLGGDKRLDDNQVVVNTGNSMKTGFDGITSNNEEQVTSYKETEGWEEIGHGVFKELMKVWFCMACNEESKDAAALANHRKSSKHVKKLHSKGGGIIVFSSILKEAVEGEKDSEIGKYSNGK